MIEKRQNNTFPYKELFLFLADIANGQEVLFNYGETVKVIGASPKAGFLTVETRDKTGWVPYKLTKLMVTIVYLSGIKKKDSSFFNF